MTTSVIIFGVIALLVILSKTPWGKKFEAHWNEKAKASEEKMYEQAAKSKEQRTQVKEETASGWEATKAAWNDSKDDRPMSVKADEYRAKRAAKKAGK